MKFLPPWRRITLLKPLDECLYYIVRADCGGIPEKDVYFEDALEHIRQIGFENLAFCPVELRALISAARRRGRLEELDRLVEAKRESENWIDKRS